MADPRAQQEIDDPVISIGVLAQKVGLSVSAVRRYENERLIIAHRTGSRHRLFSHADVNRVRNIHHMIRDLGLNIEGIRRMQAILPCWDLLPCRAETRRRCPAYEDTTRPCWMASKLGCVEADECRQCVVYRFGSLCTEDIKRLLRCRNDVQDAEAAIGECVQGLGGSRQES